MAKITVDIDDNLIQEARRVLGTSSVKETIHAALLEVLCSDARRQETRVLAEMDGLDLADKDVMARAWRS